MKLVIESTSEVVFCDGLMCRVWKAELPGDKGGLCALVARIVVPEELVETVDGLIELQEQDTLLAATVAPGSLVQREPEAGTPVIAIVDRVEPWGVVCYVPNDGGHIWLRLDNGSFRPCGFAAYRIQR